jgi:hypothetical protein
MKRFLSGNGWANRIFKLFVLSILVISCDREDVLFEAANIDFDLPQYMYVGQPVDLTVSTTEFDNASWKINDTSELFDNAITYTFNRPGDYKIDLTVYKNRVPVGSKSKILTVLSREKVIPSDNPFHAVRGFAVNQNKIVLEGFFQNETDQRSYLVFDYQFNCLDTLSYSELIASNLLNSISVNNNLFQFDAAIQSQGSGMETESFKLSGDNLSENTDNLISYAGGYINYYSDPDKGLIIDYYSKDLTKLWTKYFSVGYDSKADFLFNLNDKLYYLSFNKTNNDLYIENFKNISLTYHSINFNIGSVADDLSILFAVGNAHSQTISVGVYSKSEDKSYIYEINADCNVKLLKTITGYFESKIQCSLVDGSMITREGFSVSKYSDDWKKLNAKTMETEDFGVCQIASNLFLVFSNTGAGLSLSYIDKNLCEVSL